MHSALMPFVVTLVRAPVEIALLLALLLAISPMLTLVALSTSVGTLLLIRTARQYLRRYSQRMQHAAAQYTSTLQEGVAGIRIVKAFRLSNGSLRGLRAILSATSARQSNSPRSAIWCLRSERRSRSLHWRSSSSSGDIKCSPGRCVVQT